MHERSEEDKLVEVENGPNYHWGSLAKMREDLQEALRHNDCYCLDCVRALSEYDMISMILSAEESMNWYGGREKEGVIIDDGTAELEFNEEMAPLEF